MVHESAVHLLEHGIPPEGGHSANQTGASPSPRG